MNITPNSGLKNPSELSDILFLSGGNKKIKFGDNYIIITIGLNKLKQKLIIKARQENENEFNSYSISFSLNELKGISKYLKQYNNINQIYTLFINLLNSSDFINLNNISNDNLFIQLFIKDRENSEIISLELLKININQLMFNELLVNKIFEQNNEINFLKTKNEELINIISTINSQLLYYENEDISQNNFINQLNVLIKSLENKINDFNLKEINNKIDFQYNKIISKIKFLEKNKLQISKCGNGFYICELNNGINGMLEGKGISICEEGDIYFGDFKENKFNGRGIYKYANGESYIGEFNNGLRHGKGKIYDKNGNIKSEGMYENNKKIK